MGKKNRNNQLSELVDKARNNINQNNIGGDSNKTYQFGSTDGFGFGSKYWNHNRRKIKAIRFLSEVFK